MPIFKVFDMITTQIKKLLELIHGTNIAEIVIKDEKESIRIKHNSYLEKLTPQVLQNNSETNKIKAIDPIKIEDKNAQDIYIFRSPMVGTVYLSSDSDKKPFVVIGDHVEEGQVICIIKAMKIRNEIKSNKSGKISYLFVENEDSVEFNQPLFAINQNNIIKG